MAEGPRAHPGARKRRAARGRQAGGSSALLATGLLACLSCTSVEGPATGLWSPPAAAPAVDPRLVHRRLDPRDVHVQPEGLTVEQSWILDLYTLFHSRNYRAFRLLYPDEPTGEAVAHLLLPPGPGPHPAVLVFPVLGGSLVISEALAKALVNRHYAVIRLERRPLALRSATSPQHLPEQISAAVRDARRLLDWAETRPDIDATRVATAGASFGGILASLLQAVDDRVDAGVFLLAGGGLPELLYDSREPDLRFYRDRLTAEHGLDSRADFIAFMKPRLEPVDPLRYAARVDPARALLVSARFDRVVPPARAEALWLELGRPARTRLPTGHLTALPLLWYAANRGADHLDALFGAPRR